MHTARWVGARRSAQSSRSFSTKAYDHLALDHSGALVYLAPSRVNLQLTHGALAGHSLHETREHLADAAAERQAADARDARAQWAWALTAWANHAFTTTVLVGLFPIFFGKYWAAELPGTTLHALSGAHQFQRQLRW